MRERVHARRTLKGLVADLRFMQISIISSFCENKTNLCSQFSHISCTFALEIKKYESGKSYNIFLTFPFSDIDIIRMWNKYKENEIKILVIWN